MGTWLIAVEPGREYVVHGQGDVVLQFQRLAFRTFDQNRTYSQEYNVQGAPEKHDMFSILCNS